MSKVIEQFHKFNKEHPDEAEARKKRIEEGHHRTSILSSVTHINGKKINQHEKKEKMAKKIKSKWSPCKPNPKVKPSSEKMKDYVG